MINARVTFVSHHVTALNGRSGVVIGRVSGTFYSWRVWVCRRTPIKCGPMIPVGRTLDRCTACGWSSPAEPKTPREDHYWFDPTDIHSFVIEANESTFKIECAR